MVLWPLEGLRRPHTPQIPNIPSHQVKMSDKPPSKKPKVARGKSDGKYLEAHGLTNKFQAEWLEHPVPERQPRRKDWLSDRGVDEKNWFQAHCSICPATFQCRKQAITGHESSNSHKDKAAAWLKKQQARAGWQGQLNKGADYSNSACSPGS